MARRSYHNAKPKSFLRADSSTVVAAVTVSAKGVAVAVSPSPESDPGSVVCFEGRKSGPVITYTSLKGGESGDGSPDAAVTFFGSIRRRINSSKSDQYPRLNPGVWYHINDRSSVIAKKKKNVHAVSATWPGVPFRQKRGHRRCRDRDPRRSSKPPLSHNAGRHAKP